MAEQPKTTPTKPRYLTVRQFCDAHPWATHGGIRHLVFHAKSNGFDRCIRRVGRRILINEDEFFNCIEEQNAGESRSADV